MASCVMPIPRSVSPATEISPFESSVTRTNASMATAVAWNVLKPLSCCVAIIVES